MTETIKRVQLSLTHCVGYGSDADAAARIERALDPDMTSGNICALRVLAPEEGRHTSLTGIRAISMDRAKSMTSTVMAGLKADQREALGGLFFLYVNEQGVRVGPRKPKTPRPAYFFTSHGIVILDSGIIKPGITQDYVREHMERTTLLLVGRNRSNHEQLVFASQAKQLIECLAAINQYRDIEVSVSRTG